MQSLIDSVVDSFLSEDEEKMGAAHSDCSRCDKSRRNKAQRDRASRERTIGQKSKQKQINRKTKQTQFKRPNPAGRPKACRDAEDKPGCIRSYKKKKQRAKQRRKMDKKSDIQMTLKIDEMDVDTTLEAFDQLFAEYLAEEGLTEEEFNAGNFPAQDDQYMEDFGEEDGGDHLGGTNQKLRNTLRKNKGQRARSRARTVKRNRNPSSVHSRHKGKPGGSAKTKRDQRNQRRWRKRNPGKLKMYQRRRKRASVEVVAQRWLQGE